jgi:hypothetical protein
LRVDSARALADEVIHGDTQVAERRAEARTEVAQAALETELSIRDVEALRRSAEEGWRSKQDTGRLKTRAVRVCEEALARAQRELERARATQDPTELREVGLKAVRTADMDTLYAMAVHAAAADGADVNTRPKAAAGALLRLTAIRGLVETVRALVDAARGGGRSTSPTCRDLLPAQLPRVGVQFRDVVQQRYPEQVRRVTPSAVEG